MELRKRLRAPWIGAAIELVDDAETATEAAEAQEAAEPQGMPVAASGRRRTRALLKVAVPALAAAIAVVAAVVALTRQPPAAQDVRPDAKSPAYTRDELNLAAGQVAFWPDEWARPPDVPVVVENLGSTPVRDVRIQVFVDLSGLPRPAYTQVVLALRGAVPACSAGRADIARAAIAAMEKPAGLTTARIIGSGSFRVAASALVFRDDTGAYWRDAGPGQLTRISAHAAAAGFRPAAAVSVTGAGFRRASGCS
ncbi:MAG TPA: hypothetical protein VG164_07505 [Trebonia sp.]|nr:hypothetical protein [Trebonia sp.]